jgi:hypothetical protein
MTQSGEMNLNRNQLGSVYAASFGNLPDGTRYVDRGNDVDLRSELKSRYDRGRELVEAKAMNTTTGGAGTAGYALIPVAVDPRIVDQSRKYTPMVEIVPRETNIGITADYNVLTAKGGGFTAAEDSALSAQDDTYNRESQSIKYLYSVGRITGPGNAAIPSYMLEGFQSTGAGYVGSGFQDVNAPNGLQTEVLVKARAMKELEENLFWNGNATTSGVTGNPNGTEFNGIIAQQSTTNQNDVSDYLSWDEVEDTVKLSFDDGGRPNVAGADSSTVNDVRKIMRDQFRWNGGASQETAFGVPSSIMLETMVGRVPLIPSMYLDDSSGSKQLWFLDMNQIAFRVLQDMTYEELAKTNDSKKFMLKQYEALVVKAPSFNAYADNLT